MGKYQRTKGHNFERLIAKTLRGIGIDARRGRQDYSGTAEPDVVILDKVIEYELDPWIECKVGKSPRLWAAMDQATEACGDREPIVIAHKGNGRTVAVMDIALFLALLIKMSRG